MTISVDQGGRYNPLRLSAGAGRFTDQIWPDPLEYTTTAAGILHCRNRLLNSQLTFAAGGFGGGGATVNLQNLAAYGCMTAHLVGGGADGVGQLMRFNTGTCAGIYQHQAKSGIPSSDYQPWGAGRVYAIYAYPTAFGGGSAVADSGLELTTSGGLIQSQSTAGVGFCRSATNVIIARCQTVGAGASSNVAVTGAGTALTTFDDSKLNVYELQTVDATASADASITWLINGIAVRKLTYAAGTALPPLTAGVNGLFTALIANLAQNVNIDVMRFHVIQAPTITDCF